jgi:hypothetical protein
MFLDMASKLSKGPGEILDPSFPSAHSAFAFMMAVLLSHWFPKYRVIFLLLPDSSDGPESTWVFIILRMSSQEFFWVMEFSVKLEALVPMHRHLQQVYKEIYLHPGGHSDYVPGVSETDLQFLSQHLLTEDPQTLSIITDEAKDYYWLRVDKKDTLPDAWHGWVE